MPRPKMCVRVGVGGVNGVCFFLRVSSKQTTTRRGQKQVEATGAAAAAWAALLVDCSTVRGACGDCEFGNGRQAEICVEENLSRRLAVSPILLPFLGKREVTAFRMCRPSQAMGLLRSFSRADALFFQQEKHGSSRSLRLLFVLETRENSLKFFSSSGLIYSLSLGMRGGNYCGLLPCKRSINFVPVWGRGCRNSFRKLGMKDWVCFVLSGIIYFKKFSEFLFSIP